MASGRHAPMCRVSPGLLNPMKCSAPGFPEALGTNSESYPERRSTSHRMLLPKFGSCRFATPKSQR